MEIKNFVVIGILGFLGVSCTTVNQPQVNYFHETPTANLIVSHSSDEANYAIRPPVMEGSFRTMLTLADIAAIAQGLPDKNLAVVSIGVFPNPNTEAEKVKNLSVTLADCGFKRVVFVRNASRKTDRTDGLEIRADVRF